jgi:Bacterial transcriptional activator domain/LysM domain
VTTLIHGTARLIKALGALVALTALLGALPYALVRFVGWPLPSTVPTWPGIQKALTSPPSTTLYIDILACLIWLCVLVLAVSFLIELSYALRHVHAPHIPGLGPGQLLAAALIAAIGLGAGAARPAAAATNSSPLPSTIPAATAQAHPASATPAPAARPAGQAVSTPLSVTSVTVVPGDTLYGIAKATLGNGDDWPTLYHENADAPEPGGAHLTDPNLIRPGWTILIDDATSGPASTTPAVAPATPAPAPTHPAPVAAHPAPAVTNTATAPETAPSPVHQTSHAAQPAPAVRRHGASGGVRIDLADGGAIAGSLFIALLGAVALTRRHRRRFTDPYWPTHATIPVHDELPRALHPAPPTAGTALLATAEDQAEDELDEFGAPLTVAEPLADSVEAADQDALAEPDETFLRGSGSRPDPVFDAHEQSEFGEQGSEVAVPIALAYADQAEIAVDQLPGGMGLIGPGALGAARAIAAAVLADGAAENRLDRARLLVGRDDLALLLECDPEHLDEVTDGVAELDLADDLPAALSLLEEHLAYRARQLEDYDCADLDELADQHGDLEPHPPLILLGVTRQAVNGRLKATVAAGEGLRAHAVLLGSHPGRPTWHIAADGQITGEDDERIPAAAHTFDLSADALRQTLVLLAQATGRGLRNQPAEPAPDPTGPLAVPLGLGHYADPEPDDPDTVVTEETEPTAASTDAADTTDQGELGAADAPTEVEVHQDPQGGSEPADDSEPAHFPAPARPLSIVAAEMPGDPEPTETGPTDTAPTDAVTALLEEFRGKLVRVRILGPLLIEDAHGPITTGLRSNSRRLAARLALHHRRGQSGEELAVLWPDLSGKDLSETRKTAMAYLRGPLKKATGATSAQFVLDASGRYCLDPHLVGVDLAVFDQLRVLAAGSRDPGERAAATEAALSLYDGELLTGNDEPWTIAPRADVRREALACAALLAQLAADTGEPETALAWWEHARSIDENDEVYHQIFRALATLGRRAELIAARDALIAKLESIGESLSPQTEQLLGELLRERPRPAAVASAQPVAA